MLICCDLLNDFLWEFHACCWPKFLSVPQTQETDTRGKKENTSQKHLRKPNDILSAPHVWLIEKRQGKKPHWIEWNWKWKWKTPFGTVGARCGMFLYPLVPQPPSFNPPIWSMCVCHANLNLSKTKGGGNKAKESQSQAENCYTGKNFFMTN